MNIKYTCILLLILATFLGCEKNDSNSSADSYSNGGKGGSLARFAIRGHNLYTVNSSSLRLFNISNSSNPALIKDIPLSNGGTVVETVFIRDDSTMFIGSQDGVYIFSIKDPVSPAFLSLYTHIKSCDPVVADGRYAFSTLRVSGSCNSGVNQLDVIDLADLTAPSLVYTTEMTNPIGVGISGNLLFVCDEGLKVYDRSDVYNLQLVEKFSIPAIDVIPVSGRLIVLAEDGLYQYSYSTGNLALLSHLAYN